MLMQVVLVRCRFDYHITQHDRSQYLTTMSAATNATNIHWVVNNPYEGLYAAKQGVHLPPERTTLIRPVGYSPFLGHSLNLSHVPVTANGLNLVVVEVYNEKELLIPILDELQIPFTVYKARQYNGPRTLAQYDAVVILPYQCSVMSLVENLVAGSVQMLPSPQFLYTLIMNSTLKVPNSYPYHWSCMEALGESTNDTEALEQYIEWYHSYFADAMVYFDSWQHLLQLTIDPSTTSLLAHKRKIIREKFSQQHGKQVIAAWRGLLEGNLGVQLGDTRGCGVECSKLGSKESREFLTYPYTDPPWHQIWADPSARHRPPSNHSHPARHGQRAMSHHVIVGEFHSGKTNQPPQLQDVGSTVNLWTKGVTITHQSADDRRSLHQDQQRRVKG